jgi:hypothetical protein
VVVAGYKVNKIFFDENKKTDIKGKSYNLYEKNSFIHLLGENLILINIQDDRGQKLQ